MLQECIILDQHNAKGQGNIKENLSAAIEVAKANTIDIFLLLDHDANWSEIISDFTKRGSLRRDMYHVWNKDFESDNFKTDDIVEKVNKKLVEKLYHRIEVEDIRTRANNRNLSVTKAIDDSIWEKNGVKKDEVMSKKELGEILIQDRIAEIRNERCSEGWKPLLPIEKILHEIFVMIPKVIR